MFNTAPKQSEKSHKKRLPRFPRIKRLMEKRNQKVNWYATADHEGMVQIRPNPKR